MYSESACSCSYAYGGFHDERCQTLPPRRRLRDDICCVYCGVTEFDSEQYLHRDHFFPKSRGGRDRKSNRVLSCFRCNSIKAAHVFDTVHDVKVFIHEVSR
jgi:5-methylcytosine-specific restriction endonuclease McrA